MMIFYCLLILCITSMINGADKIKAPERVARRISPTKMLEKKEEKRREQSKKEAEKKVTERSLKSLTGSCEDIEEEFGDELDRLMLK